MTDFLRNNPIALRICILYDVRSKKSIDESYKNLCEAFGQDAISYGDFDFWYYRFTNGKFDLDFDRSTEPKPLEFSDLTIDVLKIIIEKSELKEQLRLRKVSRTLRDLTDQVKTDYKKISFRFGENYVHMEVNDFDFVYTSMDAVIDIPESRILRVDDYIQCAFKDLSCALKNPKIQLDMIDVEFEAEWEEAPDSEYKQRLMLMKNFMTSLNHKISTRETGIDWRYQEDVMTILPCLKPGILESFHFYVKKDGDFDEIANLEQWKQAKYAHIQGLVRPPMEHFWHMEEFHLMYSELSMENLEKLRDALFKSPNFKKCEICYRQGSIEIEDEEFREELHLDEHFRYRIPGTNNVLKYRIQRRHNGYDEIYISKEEFVDYPPVLEDF